MNAKTFENACLKLTQFAVFPKNYDFSPESIVAAANQYLAEHKDEYRNHSQGSTILEGVDFANGVVSDPSLFLTSCADLSLLKETEAVRTLMAAVAIEKFTDESDRVARAEINRLRFNATQTLELLGHPLMDRKMLIKGKPEEIQQLKGDLENQHVDDLWTVTQVKMKEGSDGQVCVVHFPNERANEVLALAEEATGISTTKLVTGIRETEPCVAGYVDADDYDHLYRSDLPDFGREMDAIVSNTNMSIKLG